MMAYSESFHLALNRLAALFNVSIGLARFSRARVRCQMFGAAVCGEFFGSPVYGCSTIGLAHSRNLVVSALRALPGLNLKIFRPAAMIVPPISSAATICRCRKNFDLGLPFCGPAAPFTAVVPSGWPTVATCRSKPNTRSLCRSRLPKARLPKHVTAIARSFAEPPGPFGCAQKTALTKLRSQNPHERKKPHPAGGDPPARTESIQELIHQPGAAPPSSSTGRQLNSSGSPHLVWQPAKSLKFF